MVGDAEAHAAEDAKFRELVEARNQADGLVHATEKSLRELGDKVSGEERAKIESALADLKEAIKGDDKTAIDTKLKALARRRPAWRSACTRPSRRPAARAGTAVARRGRAGGDDNVVDAEFEEVKDDKQRALDAVNERSRAASTNWRARSGVLSSLLGDGND